MTFNFYALIPPSDRPGVFRIPVTASLQAELSTAFGAGAERMLGNDLARRQYDPRYRPEAGEEVFELQPFALPAELLDLAGSAPTLDAVSEDLLESGEVRAILGVHRPGRRRPARFVFQRVESKQIIRRSFFNLFLSGEVFTKSERSGIVVTEQVDAVFEGDSLVFISDHFVRRFLDLSRAFDEATDARLADFAKLPCFAPIVDGVLPASDQWVRRKVASILEGGLLDSLDTQHATEVARGYGITLQTRQNGKKPLIVLPSEKAEFKNVLRFLDEDYLESELTTTRFQVNSKRALKSRE